MNLLHIQNGDHTINLNFISEIDWTCGETEALVTMSNGNQYTVEDEDYFALREKLGMSAVVLQAVA